MIVILLNIKKGFNVANIEEFKTLGVLIDKDLTLVNYYSKTKILRLDTCYFDYSEDNFFVP